MANPNHPDLKDMFNWLGGERCDPEALPD